MPPSVIYHLILSSVSDCFLSVFLSAYLHYLYMTPYSPVIRVVITTIYDTFLIGEDARLSTVIANLRFSDQLGTNMRPGAYFKRWY